MNRLLYQLLSKLCPGLFFFWLEKAKSFHMTVGITLLIFAVIHSVSHMVNLWNFSRNFDEERKYINFAQYKGQNPFSLLLSPAGLTGVSMLLIILSMGVTSMRIVRRKNYNVFWYTHQIYLLFIVLLIIHPLSGILKEEVMATKDKRLNSEGIQINFDVYSNNTTNSPQFMAIKSKTIWWMAMPLSFFLIDLLWRILSRNRAGVKIVEVHRMAGHTLRLTMTCPHEEFYCRMGQYVLIQCRNVSLLEWHPFTIVKVPTSSQREFTIWIRVKGDWTEAVEELLMKYEYEPNPRFLVDGPFSSPMEGILQNDVVICVAAGVGITPYVSILQYISEYPRSPLPGRVHLLWIVRDAEEISWLTDLLNRTIIQLRNYNRPDRLHFLIYITGTKEKQLSEINCQTHTVVINNKGDLEHIITKNGRTFSDDEKISLLTPHKKRTASVKSIDTLKVENNFDVSKQYPLLGCRMRRGRPHWDQMFGYWVHLYPRYNLNLYCCGPKKLVKLLNTKCKHNSLYTKTKFTFVHEAFS